MCVVKVRSYWGVQNIQNFFLLMARTLSCNWRIIDWLYIPHILFSRNTHSAQMVHALYKSCCALFLMAWPMYWVRCMECWPSHSRSLVDLFSEKSCWASMSFKNHFGLIWFNLVLISLTNLSFLFFLFETRSHYAGYVASEVVMQLTDLANTL